ncbi:hypothetical protein INR49_029620 [Caranx melampygus]|nr:hypothetical protein INR49_029620 [Caranx melampygus]
MEATRCRLERRRRGINIDKGPSGGYTADSQDMYGSARTVGHIESSPARSPRLPRSPRLGHRRANSGGGGGAGGKTLSMENIQSLNAAYATSGPMYLSDHEGVGSTATYPKGTMTLGRATSRAMYGGRVTAMGSSPNIASVGLPMLTFCLTVTWAPSPCCTPTTTRGCPPPC